MAVGLRELVLEAVLVMVAVTVGVADWVLVLDGVGVNVLVAVRRLTDPSHWVTRKGWKGWVGWK